MEERDEGMGPCVSGRKWLWRRLQEGGARSTIVPEQGNSVRNCPMILDDRSMIGRARASLR